MKLIRIFSIALIAMSISLVSCSGEDGEQGPKGNPGGKGDQGLTGDKGDPGQDGTDGVGFDELTQYGFVTLELDGVRSDGVEFTDSSTFKFTNINIGDYPSNEFAKIEIDPEQTVYGFGIGRWLSAPDDVYQDTYIYMQPAFINLGQETEEMVQFYFDLSNYAVIGNDNKYFVLNIESIYPSPEMQNLEITDLVFDEEDNHLTYSFAFDVTANGNDTGNPLSVSGMADVYVLEKIQGD